MVLALTSNMMFELARDPSNSPSPVIFSYHSSRKALFGYFINLFGINGVEISPLASNYFNRNYSLEMICCPFFPFSLISITLSIS